jgi:hypothetical protein
VLLLQVLVSDRFIGRIGNKCFTLRPSQSGQMNTAAIRGLSIRANPLR